MRIRKVCQYKEGCYQELNSIDREFQEEILTQKDHEEDENNLSPKVCGITINTCDDKVENVRNENKEE